MRIGRMVPMPPMVQNRRNAMRRPISFSLGFSTLPCLLLGFCWLVLSSPVAGARNLLIQGGTLIDGTGKAPTPDVRIFVEGNVIRRIWTGEAAQNLPPDTQIVDARGKFILPGFIDSHVHYRGYMGELFLSYGVTTVYDLGNPIYWQAALKKGLNSGKIRGPRYYFCSAVDEGEGEGENAPAIRAR